MAKPLYKLGRYIHHHHDEFPGYSYFCPLRIQQVHCLLPANQAGGVEEVRKSEPPRIFFPPDFLLSEDLV